MTAGDDKRDAPRIVFCGGCNPHIDRGAVAAELGEDETADGATVYLSGCARACASDHRLTADEPGAVVVAGESVDGSPTPRDDIVATVRQKLKE